MDYSVWTVTQEQIDVQFSQLIHGDMWGRDKPYKPTNINQSTFTI